MKSVDLHKASGAGSPVVVVVLAAGRGERFAASGGALHKLDTPLNGKPVLAHVTEAAAASGLAWALVRPEGGTAGMGDSIALGVRACPEATGWLILPGDLPLVRPESIRAVAEALEGHSVVVPRFRGTRGHPVGFAGGCFPGLAGLTGDAGAFALVQAERQAGRVLDLDLDDVGITLDVDCLDDLHVAEQALQARLAPGRR